MQYEIKAFDKITGSAVVRFWNDDFPIGYTYNVDIPIVDGAYISGDALVNYIMAFAPHGQIQRVLDARAVDPSVVESLVVVPPAPPEKTAEQLATEARNESKRNRAEYVAGIKVTTQSGRIFDGDETSQTRMSRAIVALQATNTNTTQWRLADNSTVEVTIAELIEALALAGKAQTDIWMI